MTEYSNEFKKEVLDKQKETERVIDELERMRASIEDNYYLFDMNDNVFRTFYNENEDIWEIIFKGDSFTIADSQMQAEYLCMLCQIIYIESLTEGILIGINNPEVGANLLKKKSNLDTDIHSFGKHEQVSFDDLI